MNGKRFLPLLATLALLASACTEKNTGDEPNTTTDVPAGLNRFLLFPNPLAMNTGGYETNTTDYADAYYRAIDPNNDKDTIDKWKTANSFGSGGNELLAVFRDAKDLGYGRRMTGRMNTDGSVAFYVENYNVTPNASSNYSSVLNVEAAIRRDTRWHVGTNAIEWSTAPCSAPELAEGCNPNIKFAKYFNFSSKDGTRQLAVDLDGNGLKAMPGPCITCHGGRGDPLTPPEVSTGKPRFPLVENSVSRKRGDVQARLHGMNVDSFGYSPDIAGFSKTDQQATLKTFNQWILCTYPLPAASVNAEDACRVTAGQNEWQGTAAEMIKAWYGGPGMSQGTFNDLDSSGLPLYVPAGTTPSTGWSSGAVIPNTNPPLTDTELYKEVVAPFCRTCHILRGTKNQDDLDFTTLAKFQSYADRIKAHVFDRGTMPLALIVYDDFWNSNAPAKLANFIDAVLGAGTATSGGAVLRPGRPIANPGPNRMVRTATDATLTGENSLFANSFSWSQVSSNPAGLNATITNPNSMIATFNAPAAGAYVVRLTAGSGSQTNSSDVTITADDAFPNPLNLKFAHVKNVLQNITHTTPQATGICTDCHKPVATPAPTATPPIWYTNFDRDGNGGAVDATDDAWFLKSLSGRVNLTEIEASPILRKPSGNHHNGKMLLDVTDTASNGGLSDYSIIYNWILAGMPAGGVAANAGANTISPPLTLTFNGVFPGPFTANIPLDGSKSVGISALSYLWTVASEPPGGSAVFPGNAFTSGVPITTLTIQQPGTYIAQLQVSDGPSTDVAQRTIVVNETPLAANLVVAGLSAGNVSVTFAGTPAAGSIGVTANQTAGNPVTCGWQVAPTALNPSATGVSVGPSSCSGATLNVLPGAIGSQFTVTLTEQNLTLLPVPVSQTFTVQAGAGSNPSGASFSAISSTALGWTGTPAVAATRTFTNVTLQGSASGPGPLNFSWSATLGSAGCSIPAGASTSTTKSLTITGVGSCSVTMTVSNSILPNATSTQTVTITSATQFSDVAAILGNPYPVGGPAPGAGCTNCHGGGGANTPSWINNASLSGNLNLVTDGTQNSVLLLCPSVGNAACPGMPTNQPGFGNGDFSNYNAFLTWILNGKP